MNILTLSTYPIDIPLHGGQHRLHNIVEAYRSVGHAVQAAGVSGSSEYPITPGFVPYPGMTAFTPYIANPFLMDDWAIGQLFEQNDQYFTSLAGLISPVPDLIHVEQPWLFKFAMRYAKLHPAKNIKFIYGSQNIEHGLKFDIVNNYMGLDFSNDAEEKVLCCEVEAINAADGICCVSAEDLNWTKIQTNVPCVLALNGVKIRCVTPKGLSEANTIAGHKKFALYSASAHPPNIDGFFDIFEGGVGCIAPDQIIVISGSAGPNIKVDPRFQRTAGLEKVCVMAGTVSEECLQGLLELAHSVILPITHGGGTNLKTAEALWAAKHVVATTTAFRGFDKFKDAAGVSISDDPSEFLGAVRKSMESPPNVIGADQRIARRSVLWSETLTPLLAMIADTKDDFV